MSVNNFRDNEFIDKLTRITGANLSNEQFGVSELAMEAGMSRSTLHRRVKSATGLSISQFIRRVRLEKAHSLLKDSSATVTEIAFDCGFHSVSYFTKCFRDHFGYPPGQIRKVGAPGYTPNDRQPGALHRRAGKRSTLFISFAAGIALVAAAVILLIILKPLRGGDQPLDKSIAVVPFRNNSPDDMGKGLVDVIQVSIIENLSKIKDIRPIEPRSLEQYCENPQPSHVIAKEMNVSYVLDGDALMIEDHIRLSLRLIEAKRDKLLWTHTFTWKTEETMMRISEIPQLVAAAIHAEITPEEKELLKKTSNISLRAKELYFMGTDRLHDAWMDWDTIALAEAASCFFRALEIDTSYAEVYAMLADVHVRKYLFENCYDKEKLDSCIKLVDKALSINDHCAEAYAVKGRVLFEQLQWRQSVDILNKGIQYDPNYWLFYYNLGLNYENLAKPDSALASYYQASQRHRGRLLPEIYWCIGLLYGQFGFADQAGYYYQEVFHLTGDTVGYYRNMARVAGWVHDFEESVRYNTLGHAMVPDDIGFIARLAGSYMFLRRFEESLEYYKILEKRNTEYYWWFNNIQRMAYVLWNLGYEEKAEYYFSERIKTATESSRNGYHPGYYDLAGIYAFRGNKELALENLRNYLKESTTRDYVTWPLYLKIDPLFDGIRSDPEFRQIYSDLEARHEEEHERVRNWLLENGLL